MTTPLPVPREAVLIVNARSRRGAAMFEQARDLCAEHGITLTAAHPVKDPSRLNDTVREAVRSGAPMVIVGGGDGSLSCVVDDVVGKDCVFAVLPLGTANSFARTLGLPLDLPGAVEAIASGKRRRVDLGMIDGDYFTNAAAMGLSPMIGQSVPHNLKKYLGRVGYLTGAIWCFARFRPFRAIVTDDAGEHRLWASEVRILNGKFHGGVEMSEDADVDTGDMMIQVVSGRNRWRLAWDWYARFFRIRSREKLVEEFRGRTLKLDTRPRHSISIDGEVLARTPVTVRVAERAIDVVVPA
ncbi:diacylglycerol/lipid kinase family protein [Sphingomonas turrisvirgatae]|uniref:Diacylglycerol kinase n=1 Tax=Sphingomonas turrisvirgatae TaxID=1888892 RepID=A0A1E3LU84_9SPHN|nr:diacylglycerol kinase family protein [Sphingomonas turrisvirgatae]ODP37322.1 diacylglycerol kinase [Sphingomonas turrisvirgatae]